MFFSLCHISPFLQLLFLTPAPYILAHFTVHPFHLCTLSMRSQIPDSNTFAHINTKQKTNTTQQKSHKSFKNSWGCRLNENKRISDLRGRQGKPQTDHYFLKQKWDVYTQHCHDETPPSLEVFPSPVKNVIKPRGRKLKSWKWRWEISLAMNDDYQLLE